MLHTTIISLAIQWDDEQFDPPGTWDWPTLLDLPEDEHVEILSVSEAT